MQKEKYQNSNVSPKQKIIYNLQKNPLLKENQNAFRILL